jgi:hypothetical protein
MILPKKHEVDSSKSDSVANLSAGFNKQVRIKGNVQNNYRQLSIIPGKINHGSIPPPHTIHNVWQRIRAHSPAGVNGAWFAFDSSMSG